MEAMDNVTELRSWRRLHAYELRQKGWSQSDIAEAVGVSQGSISNWLAQAARGGIDALRWKSPSGRPPRLTAEQRALLPGLLQSGPLHHGFVGEFWSRARVGELIKRQFGISYDETTVGRILKRIGYSLQKPVKRAVQRDEAAIKQWREENWPELKKKP